MTTQKKVMQCLIREMVPAWVWQADVRVSRRLIYGSVLPGGRRTNRRSRDANVLKRETLQTGLSPVSLSGGKRREAKGMLPKNSPGGWPTSTTAAAGDVAELKPWARCGVWPVLMSGPERAPATIGGAATKAERRDGDRSLVVARAGGCPSQASGGWLPQAILKV